MFICHGKLPICFNELFLCKLVLTFFSLFTFFNYLSSTFTLVCILIYVQSVICFNFYYFSFINFVSFNLLFSIWSSLKSYSLLFGFLILYLMIVVWFFSDWSQTSWLATYNCCLQFPYPSGLFSWVIRYFLVTNEILMNCWCNNYTSLTCKLLLHTCFTVWLNLTKKFAACYKISHPQLFALLLLNLHFF